MNKLRRLEISKIVNTLDTASQSLADVIEAEQDYFDNIPENLEGSERYESSEEALDQLNEVKESLDEVIQSLDNLD